MLTTNSSTFALSLEFITVPKHLLYWLVSLIPIGLVTLMIGSLLQVMCSLLVQDLLHGLARNKVPFLFLQQKQSIVVLQELVRKPCGFVRSYQSLAFSSSIRLHFGVIIKVPFNYAKIQSNISVANTLNCTCTSSESSFMTMFLKCNIVQQMIKLQTSLQRLSQRRSLLNFDLWLEFRKLSLRGDRLQCLLPSPIVSYFYILQSYPKLFLRGDVRIFRHIGNS